MCSIVTSMPMQNPDESTLLAKAKTFCYYCHCHCCCCCCCCCCSAGVAHVKMLVDLWDLIFVCAFNAPLLPLGRFNSLMSRHVMTPRPVCLRSVERAGFVLKVRLKYRYCTQGLTDYQLILETVSVASSVICSPCLCL